MDTRRLTWPIRLLLALLSAAVLALCFEPLNLSALAWVGLVPFLVSLRGASPRAIRALAFLFGFAFYGATVHWLFRIFGAPAVSLIGILAGTTWAFGTVYSLAAERFGPDRALLLAPVAWLGVDLFRSELWWFKFSWMQLGFSQVSAPLVLQSAGVVGVYGLTLLIVSVNAVLAWLILRRGLWGGAIAAVVVIAALMLGRVRVADTAVGSQGVRVAAIQTEASDLDRNLELTAECVEAGADLVVWPEYSLVEYPLDDQQTLAKLSAMAAGAAATLVVGCKEHVEGTGDDAFFNSALVIGPDGAVVGSYHKNHPVQFFNDGLPGREFPAFPTPVGRVGVAICYDMDYAPVFRQLVRSGAEVIAVPTYDAADWGRLQHAQHSAMARARAVEVRRWVVRPTSSGISQIIDPNGNTRHALGFGNEGVIVGEVLPSDRITIYARVGYLIPYLSLGLVIIFLLSEASRRLCTWSAQAQKRPCPGLAGEGGGDCGAGRTDPQEGSDSNNEVTRAR